MLSCLTLLSACQLSPVAARAGEWPLSLFITTQLSSRLSGNPDALLAVTPFNVQSPGSLYIVENGTLMPEPSGFLSEPKIEEIFRTGPYVAIRLAAPINHFGKECRNVLVHRTTLTTICLEKTAVCPQKRNFCPGKPILADPSGQHVALYDGNRNEVWAVDLTGSLPVSTKISTEGAGITINGSGEILVKKIDGSFNIFHPDGSSVPALQGMSASCFFGSLNATFYAQVGTNIQSFTSTATVPLTVFMNAPNFPCASGGAIVETEGNASMIYDPSLTDDSVLYFSTVSETGLIDTLSFTDPAKQIAANGHSMPVIFAGPGSPAISIPLVEAFGVGSQIQLLTADDLHSFDVSAGGEVYWAASWPINGTILGVYPASSSTSTTIKQSFDFRVPTMAAMK